MDFLGIGGWEIALILVIALFLMGPDKILAFARTMGKTVRVLKKTAAEFSAQVGHEFEEQKKEQKLDLNTSDQTPKAHDG